MKCDKCGKKAKQVTQFSEYGNNEERKKDDNWYCDKCLKLREKETEK